MDATLKALADLLIESVPTVVFFIFLAWYLKKTYFQPVARILEERRKATEGVRELAERAFAAADQKQSEFDHAMHLARGKIYEEHEKLRRKWSEEQAAQILEARERADEEIEAAKHVISQEAERAQAQLDQDVDGLSRQVIDNVLARRAA